MSQTISEDIFLCARKILLIYKDFYFSSLTSSYVFCGLLPTRRRGTEIAKKRNLKGLFIKEIDDFYPFTTSFLYYKLVRSLTMIQVTFPDGSTKKYPPGITGKQIALDISEGLARAALAVKFNKHMLDINTPLKEDGNIEIITFKTDEGKALFWHSSAHLLAHAIHRLYPQAKPTIGPAVENGFYYDFDDLNITLEDFPKIEEEMKKIVKEEITPKRIDYGDKEEALKAFAHNPYKCEMIEELEEGTSAYKQKDFIDLCRGPHIPNTKMIKAFKLTKLAGAYWRGNAKNKQLTRIYGISFPEKKELKQYVELLAEAERRDHRKIGRELDLYSFHEEAPGMPFFHDKGQFIWNTMAEFMRQAMIDRNYEINMTPLILNKQLWLQSGHWDHYKENMYFTKIDSDEDNFAVKPMNCPGNILIFKTNMHSYRELPIRAGEFGIVHRHELSGVLSGLFRVRYFTQDDAHVFCTEEQVKDEVKALIEFVDYIYKTFGFEYAVELSTKPEKAMGDPKLWKLAEEKLQEALEELDIEYKLNPGDGAFYGPKIDFHLKDALGRTWQCGTIQLDFQMPEKFDLTYEGQDGAKHRPVMLHRAIYGSFERFLGILVEHYAGKFPLWLSPNQVKLLPIADRHHNYAQKIADEMKQAGLRVEIDERSESIKKKVRDAQIQQWNYILVIGDAEEKNNSVNVRTRDNKVHGEVKIEKFIQERVDEIKSKK